MNGGQENYTHVETARHITIFLPTLEDVKDNQCSGEEFKGDELL